MNFPSSRHELQLWYALKYFTFNTNALAGASHTTWEMENCKSFWFISIPFSKIDFISVINRSKKVYTGPGFLLLPWKIQLGSTILLISGTFTKETKIGQKLDFELSEIDNPSHGHSVELSLNFLYFQNMCTEWI